MNSLASLPLTRRTDAFGFWITGFPAPAKTRFAGSRPGTLIAHPPTDHTTSIGQADGVYEKTVEDHAQMLELLEWAQQGGAKDLLGDDPWLWLDGVSLFEEFGLDDVFADAVERKEERKEFGPDKGEYGINRGRIATWIRNMVGLSKAGLFNFGITANVMDWYDPVREKQIWTPLFGSNKVGSQPLSAKLCGYMNVVAYHSAVTRDGERKEYMLVDAEGFIGKDQYNCFPALKSGRHGFVNPTMPEVEKAINSARGIRQPRKRPARRPRRKGAR